MKYVVKRPLQHNGKRSNVGEPIEIADARAEAELLALGAVAATDKPAKPVGGRSQLSKPSSTATSATDSTTGGGSSVVPATSAPQSGIDLDSLT